MNTENLPFIQRAFVEGGPVMYVILVIGIISVMIIIERFLALKNLVGNKKEFMDQIFNLILRGELRQAISVCEANHSALSHVVKAGLVQVLNKRPDEEVQVAMDAAVLRVQPKIEGWVALLAVTGNAAVLSGLLGTIIGMIQSFRAVAAADPAQKAEELSRGISHALNCTAFGLLVAIISVVAYGYLQTRIQRTENDLIESSMSLLNLVASNRDKIKD